MSPTHFWFGCVAVKSYWSTFGATGRLWFAFVVALNFLAALARKPCRLRLAATALRLAGVHVASRTIDHPFKKQFWM